MMEQLTLPQRCDEDSLLVTAAKTGDREAFSSLIRRHARTAARLAHRLLKNREDAEDVVQEAFARAFRKIDTFRGDATFRTWILQVTLNEAYDHLRRRKQRSGSQEDLEALLPELADRMAPTPHRISSSRDDLDAVTRALEDLPPRQKTALVLKIYEGLSYPEVAQVMGITVLATRVYLSLARQSLRRHFLRSRPDAGSEGREG